MSTAVKSSFLSRSRTGGGDAAVGPGPIDRFLDAVWMERGLSPNTLAAYRADLTALDRWLDEHEYESLAQLRGSLNLRTCPDPSAFERANYLKILQSWGGRS